MKNQRLSERLQDKVMMLEDGSKKKGKGVVATGALLGAGIGGASHLAKPGIDKIAGAIKGHGKARLTSPSFKGKVINAIKRGTLTGSVLKGAAAGTGYGVVAALLLSGGAATAAMIKKAREKGPEEAKQSIRSAISRSQNNNKLTNTQKATIKNNGQAAIAKIDQAFKNQRKYESVECNDQECNDKECKCKKDDEDKNESLGLRILEKLDYMTR